MICTLFPYLSSVLHDPGDLFLSPSSNLIFPALHSIDLALNLTFLLISSSSTWSRASYNKQQESPPVTPGMCQAWQNWGGNASAQAEGWGAFHALQENRAGTRWLLETGVVSGDGISILSPLNPSQLQLPQVWESDHLLTPRTPSSSTEAFLFCWFVLEWWQVEGSGSWCAREGGKQGSSAVRTPFSLPDGQTSLN